MGAIGTPRHVMYISIPDQDETARPERAARATFPTSTAPTIAARTVSEAAASLDDERTWMAAAIDVALTPPSSEA